MTTYLIKQTSQFDELAVADLLAFVDESGHLDVRIEGDAASRPFAILNLLRHAGFLRTHTWVEDDAGCGVALRVTAVLPAPEKPAVAATDDLPARRPSLISVPTNA